MTLGVSMRRLVCLGVFLACGAARAGEPHFDFWVELGYEWALPGMAPALVGAGGGMWFGIDDCVLCGIGVNYYGMFGNPTSTQLSPDSPPFVSSEISARSQVMPWNEISLVPRLSNHKTTRHDENGTVNSESWVYPSLWVDGVEAGGIYGVGLGAGLSRSGTSDISSWGFNLYGKYASDSSTYFSASVFPLALVAGYFWFYPSIALQVYGNSVTPLLKGAVDLHFGSTGFILGAAVVYGYRITGTTPPTGVATMGWTSPEGWTLEVYLHFGQYI